MQPSRISFTDKLKVDKEKKRAKDLLSRLATDTGGRVFFPGSKSDVEHISDQIINDIRTQYVIRYVPSGTDLQKAFHKVQVSIDRNDMQDKRIAVSGLLAWFEIEPRD